MNIRLIFRTVRWLRGTQVVHQVRNRVQKAQLVSFNAPKHKVLELEAVPIERIRSVGGNNFCFLNLRQEFSDWNFIGNGPLWDYNLNYFDYINQPEMSCEVACRWIDRYIADIHTVTWGLDPYPIALRGINWIKFFCRQPECATKEREDSLYSQYRLLERKLEYHLLGNHLLEDAFSLYIGAAYFADEAMMHRARRLLLSELKEQTLPDGAHYEQSPMYHCILLDRLLDCLNFAKSCGLVEDVDTLSKYAVAMLGHLESIVYRNGDIPLLNDSARGIAPTPKLIFDYAQRLGLTWQKLPLRECGYRKLLSGEMETVVDIGEIAASYQPGHTHADALSYELRISGEPFVVDTGISTYDKTPRRQYERSTAAHNTVTIDGKDSAEVWGGFRVGYRYKMSLFKDAPDKVEAELRGFGCGLKHRRCFAIDDTGLAVTDSISAGHQGNSYIHLAPGVQILSADNGSITTNMAKIEINGASSVEVIDEKASTKYNRFEDIKAIRINFADNMIYRIIP